MAYSKEVQAYQDHLRGLAVRYNIAMTQTIGGDRELHMAHANPVKRCVDLPEVTTDCAYAVALHEFGHLLAVGGYSPDDPCTCLKHVTLEGIHTEVRREEAAWAWARENAIDWTTGMEQTYQITIQSYRQRLDEWPEIQRKQEIAQDAAGNSDRFIEMITGLSKAEIYARAKMAHDAGKSFAEFATELLNGRS